MPETIGLIGTYTPGPEGSGHDYEEMESDNDSPVLQVESANFAIRVKYRLHNEPFAKVDPEDENSPYRFMDFANRLVGYPYVDAGVLQRNLPHPLEWAKHYSTGSYYLWCTKVTGRPIGAAGRHSDAFDTEYEGSEEPTPPDPEDENYDQLYFDYLEEYSQWLNDVQFQWAQSKYLYYEYECLFEPLLYDVLLYGDIVSEADRFTFLQEVPEQNVIQLDNKSNKIEWADTNPTSGKRFVGTVGTKISYPIKSSWVLIKWYDVLSEMMNFDNLDSHRGTLNEVEFFGYRAKTLLFNVVSRTPKKNMRGDTVYEVEFRLYRMDNKGTDHNHILTPELGYQAVKVTVDGVKRDLFETSDYTELFAPPA